MKLILVESPTKSNTIQKFISKEYKVMASYGHIRDLPRGNLGIDTEKNFEPKYVIPTKVRKVVTALKKEAKKSDSIILATDEDREGEAIAWHLTKALGIDEGQNTERIVFHEITKNAIEKALKNPRKINLNLVDAQQGRRVLDRLVGYKLSPFLWKKIARGLSAGRVQSVTLKLVVDREIEIRNFKPQEYWSISALLNKQNESDKDIETNLFKIGTKPLDKFDIKNKEDAERIKTDLASGNFTIEKIDKKETKKNPPTPFITSTLQQESAKRLRYTSKKTMFLAQRLYEKGHITYMRTDSLNLSSSATGAARKWLEENLGKNYALETPRVFKAKSKLAQEAHEAIRPTKIDNSPDTINLKEEGEMRLYELIWQRFMGSQMPQAKFDSTTIVIKAEGLKKEYGFRTSGNIMKFDGYLKIWLQKFEQKELPELEEKEKLKLKEILPQQHFTEPPPRYSEASLIKTLEENGIGRPSTYSPTISVIQARNYVEKDAGKFMPTEMGELVNKVLTENFPDIVDINFTAQMEDELDEVAHGKISWQGIIEEFYKPFAKNLEEKYEAVKREDVTGEEKTDEKCEKCKKPMIIKMGRFGKFMACSGFPDCKTTKKIEGGGGFGKAGPKSIGIKCEKCKEGDIVERKISKGRARGRRFWGCSKYPACDFATWDNPLEPKKEKKERKEKETNKQEKDK
jgi:DNA topoisomerase I